MGMALLLSSGFTFMNGVEAGSVRVCCGAQGVSIPVCHRVDRCLPPRAALGPSLLTFQHFPLPYKICCLFCDEP